jgi:hypothetical protein
VPQTQKNRHKIARLALTVVMACLPALLTTLIVATQAKASLTDFFPISPNDQNEYWHQVATFHAVGFNGGYYTHLEKPAIITASRFGVHGPFYILPLGLLANITDWTYATPIFYNMFFLAFGFFLFAWFSQLTNRQIVLAGLALSFFPPVLIYLPSAMQESIHQMAAMIFALYLGIVLTKQEKTQPWIKISAVIFTIVISLSRPSWSLLLFPLLALILPKNIKAQVGGLIAGVGSMLVIAIFIGMFITPGNNAITLAIGQFSKGWRSGLLHILGWVRNNIDSFLAIANSSRLALRIQYCLSLFLSLALVIYYWSKAKKNALQDKNFVFSLLIIIIILPIVIWSFTLYYIKNDIRFIAPYLLLTVFLLILQNKEKLVILFILVNLLVFPDVLQHFSNPVSSNFIYSTPQIKETRQIFENAIQYQPDQPNAWCNTLLLPVTLYDYRIALIPPGIGISYVLDNNGIDRVPFPVKSKYLLVTPRQLKEADPQNLIHLEKAAEFSDSTLFINRASGCP